VQVLALFVNVQAAAACVAQVARNNTQIMKALQRCLCFRSDSEALADSTKKQRLLVPSSTTPCPLVPKSPSAKKVEAVMVATGDSCAPSSSTSVEPSSVVKKPLSVLDNNKQCASSSKRGRNLLSKGFKVPKRSSGMCCFFCQRILVPALV